MVKTIKYKKSKSRKNKSKSRKNKSKSRKNIKFNKIIGGSHFRNEVSEQGMKSRERTEQAQKNKWEANWRAGNGEKPKHIIAEEDKRYQQSKLDAGAQKRYLSEENKIIEQEKSDEQYKNAFAYPDATAYGRNIEGSFTSFNPTASSKQKLKVYRNARNVFKKIHP